MSNDNKVAQDRKEKVKKDKQELFEKVFCALIGGKAYEGRDTELLINLAVSLTEAGYAAKKGVV